METTRPLLTALRFAACGSTILGTLPPDRLAKLDEASDALGAEMAAGEETLDGEPERTDEERELGEIGLAMLHGFFVAGERVALDDFTDEERARIEREVERTLAEETTDEPAQSERRPVGESRRAA